MANPVLMPDPGLMLTDAELLKMSQLGSTYEFMRMYAKGSRSFDFFDFTELAAISSYPLAVANSGGTGAANLAIPSTKVRNGAATAATGTTSGGSLSAIGQLVLRGADNCGVEMRLQLDAVTAYNLEVGLIDAVPGGNASGVTDVDTPTAAFANGAVIAIDTSQTITGLACVSKGSAASQAVQATTVASPTNLTAATYMTFSVVLRQAGTSASICQALYFINGVRVATTQVAAGSVNGATLLAPWLYLKTNNTTTKNLTLDYLAQWNDRAA